jgi:hypothetical protein
MVINEVQHNRKDSLKGQFVCYRGMAIPKALIEKWMREKYLKLDGYASTCMDRNVAMNFAARAENDENDHVLLRINMINESGKHFIYLDRLDYSNFPDE